MSVLFASPCLGTDSQDLADEIRDRHGWDERFPLPIIPNPFI
jgi:hypothetical protein